MRIRYTLPRSSPSKLSPLFVMGVSLIAGLAAVQIEQFEFASAQPLPNVISPPKIKVVPLERDVRVVKLRRFFARLHCPVQDLAPEFIRAADANHLDWRLLPSISVIESGGGKAYRNNNIFGWDNGEKAFPSIRDSIHVIASRLGRSPLYRNRNIEGKLRIYNPDESYPQSVMTVMSRIGPAFSSNLARNPSEAD